MVKIPDYSTLESFKRAVKNRYSMPVLLSCCKAAFVLQSEALLVAFILIIKNRIISDP